MTAHSCSSASADGERGLIVHLKPDGYLSAVMNDLAFPDQSVLTATHERKPVDILTSTFFGSPLVSSGGVILNMCKTEATLMNNDASERCRPKHILRVALAPIMELR